MTGSEGPFARAVENFWWFSFWTFTVVLVAVSVALAYALWHRRRGGPPAERSITMAVAAAVGATALILLVFLVLDLFTARAVAAPDAPEDALHVRVTGHQWWWEIEYLDRVPARRLLTANELHIPVGRPVRVTTRSADVIHSFWVPKLAGKRDLIPGDTSHVWLQADRAGRYRGQCAEFCGHQHAHMGLLVIAQPEAEFAAWYERQLQPAPPPTDSLRAVGRDVFTGRSCVLCHTVRGTIAGGRTGPDLTHIASRATLAAGTLRNTRGNLGGWIMDPQAVKPGAKMPPAALTGPELQALLAFLEGLQ